MKRQIGVWCVVALSALVMAFAHAADETESTVTVKGTGTGETEELALKDAYRDAVESAVGTFVDAEQMVKNDELIKDQILTQSNAYIEDYDVIDKKTENGVVKIKILARVKKQELTKKIDGVMPAKTIKLGGELKKLHAVTTTQEKRSADAVALLSNALNGVDPLAQLMEVSLASTESIQLDDSMRGPMPIGGWKKDPNEAEITYMFKFEINRDRYFKEFLPKLEQVLEQVSVEEPKPIAFIAESRDRRDLKNIYEVGMDYALKFGTAARDDARVFSVPSLGKLDYPMSQSARGRIVIMNKRSGRSDGLQVALVTEGDGDMRAIRGRRFVLDPAVAKIVYDWTNDANGGNDKRRSNRAGTPSYMVSFCGADGTILVQQTIQPSVRSDYESRNKMSCENLYCIREGRTQQCVWVVTPYMGTNAKAFYQRFTFKLPKDDLPKIDSIKIELVQ